MRQSTSMIFLQLFLAAGMTRGYSPAYCQKPEQPSAPEGDGCRKAPWMVQLTDGNATARFTALGSCLAMRGHSVRVEFLGASGARPRMTTKTGAPRAAGSSARRVVYEDLWPGIKVVFGLNPAGEAEITYVLARGADVSRIQLRYSVAVEIQEDGTRRFLFPAGPVTESSPEAWQEIDGKPVQVNVAFTALSGGAIGFKLGSYDPHYPLTIDPAY
jgi:hypothetical protein